MTRDENNIVMIENYAQLLGYDFLVCMFEYAHYNKEGFLRDFKRLTDYIKTMEWDDEKLPFKYLESKLNIAKFTVTI